MAVQKYKLEGQVFGRLTVGTYKSGKWYCTCECGAEKTASASELVRGKIKSCGCLQRERIGNLNKLAVFPGDTAHTRNGELTVICEKPMDGQHRVFEYRCFCGNNFVTRLNSIRTGNTSSCGCIAVEHSNQFAKLNKTHGKSGTPTYRRWKAMITRATNSNIKAAHCYSGRGITVCDRWRKFENFLEDMGEIPEESLSLDRIDNDKDYCKENCRWATTTQQARNKSRGGKVAGITKLPSGNWRVLINTEGHKSKHIGVYGTYEEAKQARIRAEELYWEPKPN